VESVELGLELIVRQTARLADMITRLIESGIPAVAELRKALGVVTEHPIGSKVAIDHPTVTFATDALLI
jgi:hypothetical protein